MCSIQDLRFALRSLRRDPGLLLAVVGSLVLSIGANTAFFSLVDSLLLRPLPGLADPASLVAVYSSKGEQGPSPGPGRAAERPLERQAAALFSGFALLALLLAAVGLYGVLSHHVQRRTREIGIRMALGARRSRVLSWVLGRSLGVILLGFAGGVAASVALVRLVASRLYGATPADPAAYGVAAAVLTAVALLASVLPARRAVQVDPAQALRRE